MSRQRIADEASVVTTRGLVAGKDLCLGDELVVANFAGALRPTTITEAPTASSSIELRRLLTRAGETLVPKDAEITLAGGARSAHRLVDGGDERIELVSPEDLPPLEGPSKPLAGLLPLRCLVPVGVAEKAFAVLDEMMANRLHLSIELSRTDRWISGVVSTASTPCGQWSWSDELSAIRSLCAWEIQDDDLIARARMDQPAVRRAVIGAYTGATARFRVDWLPAYHPVECRVAPEGEPWMPYTPILRALVETGPARVLATSEPGAPIIGPAIVSSA